jgi:hypothetical protein
MSACQEPTTPEAQCAVDEQAGPACEDSVKDLLKKLLDTMQEMLTDENDSNCGTDGKKAKAKCGEGGGTEGANNWLVALAEAMGTVAGKHLQEAANLADQIGQLDNGDSSAQEMTKLQAKMSAESQMGNMMMQATSNVLKTIGEALSAVARKQ